MSDGNIIEHKMPVVNTFMSKNAGFYTIYYNNSRDNGRWQYPAVSGYYYLTMLAVVVPVG
jgi:hypothetical protein